MFSHLFQICNSEIENMSHVKEILEEMESFPMMDETDVSNVASSASYNVPESIPDKMPFFVNQSSSDTSSRKRQHKKQKRRQKTVQGVTNEARIVLEQFLTRSLSQNDTSPIKHREFLSSDKTPICSTTGLITGIPASMQPIIEQGTPQQGSSLDINDDASSYSPVSKTTSVYSGSSRSSSFHNRNHKIRPVAPEVLEEVLQAHARNQLLSNGENAPHRRSLRRKHKSTTSSCTASEESDTNVSDNEPRRKKTIFKRATERVQQSFRRIKEREKTSEQSKLAASARKLGRPNSQVSQTASIVTSRDDYSPVGVASVSDNGSLFSKGSHTSGKKRKSKKSGGKENSFMKVTEGFLKSIRAKKSKTKKGNYSK